jgi:hypothetical protein
MRVATVAFRAAGLRAAFPSMSDIHLGGHSRRDEDEDGLIALALQSIRRLDSRRRSRPGQPRKTDRRRGE